MPAWRYLTADELIKLGESFGIGPVADRGELEAALSVPSACYGGTDRHPDIAAKAAALAFAIAKIYHPFLDGNKRAAAIAMLATCWLNGYRLMITQHELVGIILAIAELDTATVSDDQTRTDLAHLLRSRLG